MRQLNAQPDTNLIKADSSKGCLQTLVLSHRPLIQAYLGDCMTLMASTADNHYDLAIVDPPYGINISSKAEIGYRGFNVYKPKNWDKKPPNPEYFTELRRVSKNQIIWGGNYYGLDPTMCFLIWDKGEGFYGRSFAECEMAWTSFETHAKIYKRDPLAKGDYKGKIHVNQKPVALYRWLLKNYAKAGQRILDTHGGSFSSAIACHTEGFEMDICEIDKEYFDAGIKRFKDATCQLKMF